MSENKFGKTSRLFLRTRRVEGKTVVEDLSFTAPYKVMVPFQRDGGGISVMPLSASAGIMEGDRQEFDFALEEGTDVEYLSQSFDKIHKMKEGSASRHVHAQVGRNAVFFYYPQPVIPYKDSAFESHMEIHLADETSRLFLMEIICCGRSASGERFAYRRFASRVLVCRGDRMIYRDNTCYEPYRMPMEGIGMYEGYTHMANLFFTGICNKKEAFGDSASASSEDMKEKIWEILEEDPECEGGITRLSQGDYAVRIFGNRAQKLQEITEKIRKIFEYKTNQDAAGRQL